VNQVLSTHTRDDWVFEEVGSVRMPKDAYRVLLSLVPDDKLTEFGKLIAMRVQKTMMVARSNSISLDAALDELRQMSKSGWFSFHKTKNGEKRIITLVHDFGARYSVVSAAANMTLFGLVGISPKVSTTDSSVMIEY
jgi:hypothetical protein